MCSNGMGLSLQSFLSPNTNIRNVVVPRKDFLDPRERNSCQKGKDSRQEFIAYEHDQMRFTILEEIKSTLPKSLILQLLFTNQMLVFDERGKPEYPGKNLSWQSRGPRNSIHIWHRVRKSNPGHIGGGQVHSPLGQPCHFGANQGQGHPCHFGAYGQVKKFQEDVTQCFAMLRILTTDKWSK